MTTYRPPRDCPVCATQLHITQLGCPSCGTGLTGEFQPCEFCGLDDADRDVLRVFLASRGNMKDLERHLGVSYPTARARFDEMLGRLGLVPDATAAPTASTPTAPVGGLPPPPAADPRLATLRALAEGEIDVAAARDIIRPTDPAPDRSDPPKGRARRKS